MGVDLDELKTAMSMLNTVGCPNAAETVRAAVAEIRELRGRPAIDPELAALIRQAKRTRLVNPADRECSPEEDVNPLAAKLAWAIEEMIRPGGAISPAVPPWTREKPTEPGWYWMRWEYGGEAHHIVRLIENPEDLAGYWYAGSEFAGPIPLPSEPNVNVDTPPIASP